MNKTLLEVIFYSLFVLGLCLVIGGTLNGCQAFAKPINEPQPTVKPESYFTAPEAIEEPPYNPCKDNYLQYERSQESEQRKKQCGIKE